MKFSVEQMRVVLIIGLLIVGIALFRYLMAALS